MRHAQCSMQEPGGCQCISISKKKKKSLRGNVQPQVLLSVTVS